MNEDDLFINLSLSKIFQSISLTVINIINDIVSGEIKTFGQLLTSIYSTDKIIYLGLLMVIIAFFIYLVDLTS